MVSTEINSLQTNDLEKLNRNKRQNNNKGLNIDSSLNVSSDSKEYFKSLKNVFNDLLKNNVFYNISYTNTNTTNTHYYVINNNTYNYFFVSVNVENRENKINLIFRTSDLYIQGLTYNTTYYHFIDSTITTIPNQVSRNLCFGSNYNSLIGDSNPSLSWVGIEQAFNDLINYAENPDSQSTIAVIRGALARVVWATSESMRFNLVRRMLTNIDTTSYWISDLKKFVVGIWAATTDSAMEYYRIYGNLNGFANIQAQNPSRILIFTSAFLLVLKQCNNRNARSLNSDLMCYKNSSMIDISSLELEFDELDQYYGYHDLVEIKDVNDNYAVFVRTTNGDAYYLNGRDELWKYTVPFPVTSIYRFETNIYNRNVGDVYFGTTNGVYLAKMGSWRADTKINGINDKNNHDEL